jgi:hypothetical protein
LVNRYYIVHSKFANLNNNWLLQQNIDYFIYLNNYEIENNEIEKLKIKRIKDKLNNRLIIKKN